jgi:predicted membrane protein
MKKRALLRTIGTMFIIVVWSLLGAYYPTFFNYSIFILIILGLGFFIYSEFSRNEE